MTTCVSSSNEVIGLFISLKKGNFPLPPTLQLVYRGCYIHIQPILYIFKCFDYYTHFAQMHFDMQTDSYSGASSFFLRHTFWQYRKEKPRTRVGEPPPDGLPGFNSGVMLLDLGAMRSSALYNKLLEPSNVAKLADQYRFRGHLGDQDFFTMIGMEHPELFYSLACGWNRQLCTWWRDHGYGDIFQLYYRCDGPVYIYHGNCNTPIPDD